MEKKSLIRILVVTALILSIPLIAMQVSDEWDWDFPGLAYELVVRKIGNGMYRAFAGILLFLALLFVWAQLAVGII